MPRKTSRACARSAKRSGITGRYLAVLNNASEKGLSLETCGRPWLLSIPSSARSCATVLLIIGEPRSEWSVSWSGAIPCLEQLCSISRSARPAFSAGAPCVDVGAGRGWPAVSRAPRTRGRSLLAGPAPRWPASVVLVAVEVLQGDPQELGSFFLDLEQSLHALEAPMQPGVLPLQILYPRIQRLRLRTPLPRLQLSLRRLLALAAPEDQVGRIEALAPQQGPDFTRPLAGIGFPHDPQLVLRRESPPLRPRYHLRIGHILPRARRPALDHGGPSAPRRLASLAAAPLRVPHGRLLNAQRQVLDQAPFASPPCTLNSRGRLSH